MSDYEPNELDRIANRLIDAAIGAGLDPSTLRDARMGRNEAEAYIRDCGGTWITSAVRLLSIRAMQGDADPSGVCRFAAKQRLCAVPPLDDELRDALTVYLARLLDYEKPERPMFLCGNAVVPLLALYDAMREFDTDERRIIAAMYTAIVWRCTASMFGMRDE